MTEIQDIAKVGYVSEAQPQMFELRFVTPSMIMFANEGIKKLQFRYVESTSKYSVENRFTWSEWKDVPIVEDIK